jgi:hypothetical protein
MFFDFYKFMKTIEEINLTGSSLITLLQLLTNTI